MTEMVIKGMIFQFGNNKITWLDLKRICLFVLCVVAVFAPRASHLT